jgi:cytochrome c oxidase assembly protein subunit 15
MTKWLTERALRVFVWASVISQILIVVTGGAVRLTASGLGCPDWPTCDGESIVTTPEMGIHGVIEFSNRLLTFVLLVIAVGTLVLARKLQGERKLFGPAVALIAGIFVQAVIGGVSVWFKLNPWIVGLHFVVSAVMIAIAAILMWRTYSPNISDSNAQERRLTNLVLGLVAVTELVGVLVTGSGPHAGDIDTPRNGLDSELLQHIHSYPAYASLLALVALLVLVRRRDVDGYASRLVFWTLATLTGQAFIGVLQARLGLPAELVALHLLLASAIIALVTLTWLSLRTSR